MPAWFVFCFLLICVREFSLAENLSSESVTPPAEKPSLVDSTQESIGNVVHSVSEAIDTFFGDERIFQEGKTSRLIFAQTFTLREGETGSYAPKFRLKLHLPRMKNRLSLVVDNVVDPFRKDEVNASIDVDQVNDESVTTSLRYTAKSTRKININTNAGVKIRFPLDPFASLRVRRSFFYEAWELRLSENLFWFYNSGIGQVGRLDIERRLSPRWFFRWANSQTWREENEYFNFVHGLSLFQRLRQEQVLSYSAFITSLTDPTLHLESYVLSVSYRLPIWKKWLFFEMNPQLSYPISRDFAPTYAVIFRLEATFQRKDQLEWQPLSPPTGIKYSPPLAFR